MDHTLAAPVREALPAFHVFHAGSVRSRGIGFQLQRRAPVRASNARTTPLGASTRTLSSTPEPTTTRSPITAGGEVTKYSPGRNEPTPRVNLIWPSVPKS